MTSEDFVRIFCDCFRQQKFIKHKNRYYIQGSEVMIVINKQKSLYENSYYISYGLCLVPENGDLEYIKESECDLFARFKFLKDGKEHNSLLLEDFTDDECRKEINRNIEFIKVVLFHDGIIEFIERNPFILNRCIAKA